MTQLRGFLFVLIIVACPSGTLCAADASCYRDGRHGKGELKHINGLPVLILEGTPQEMGQQAGVLVGRPLRELIGFPRSAAPAPPGSNLADPVRSGQVAGTADPTRSPRRNGHFGQNGRHRSRFAPPGQHLCGYQQSGRLFQLDRRFPAAARCRGPCSAVTSIT